MIGDYDMDTPLGMNNGFYDEEYENWRKEHLQEITSNSAMSPRGAWFHYADLYDGYIYAIGEEQGNYAGGDIISVEMNGEQVVREYTTRCRNQRMSTIFRCMPKSRIIQLLLLKWCRI